MLSKYDLEEIIKAWPDKDGKSSNPEVYENSRQFACILKKSFFVDRTEFAYPFNSVLKTSNLNIF